MDSMASSTPQTKLQSCYKFTSYLIQKSRQLFVELLNLFWRFLELHLHKVVGLTVFATCVSQISALYWILLCLLLLAFPISVLNFLTYPLLTVLLGAVSLTKMVYQTPLIKERYFNFVPPEGSCDAEIYVSVV